MIDNQENKLSMYRATENTLDDNNAFWSGFTAFADAKLALTGNIMAIQAASQQQDAIITGISVDKKTLKDTLVNLAATVSGKVVGYATVVNNGELLNAVNYSHSQLDKTRDELLGQRCQNIHDQANAHLAALVAYDITAPMLATLQAAIDAYVAKTPEPRVAKAAKKAVTQNLRELFKETDKILKLRLDKFMLAYKSSEPQFYNSYKAARIIIDLGATHTKFSAFVKDMNDSPIKQAVTSLIQNTVVVYFAVSGDDGKISIIKIKPGTYDLRTEKAAYVAKIETGVQFKAGKEIKRTVTLTPGVTPPANTTVVREGDVIMGSIVEIDTSDFEVTESTTVQIEVTGNELLLSAAPSPGPIMGPAVWHVFPGIQNKTLAAFNALVGADETNIYLKVQCNGPITGHYKITFNNVQG